MSRSVTPNGAREFPGAVAGWRAGGALLGLLLAVGAGGLFLHRFAAVPRLPVAAPDWGAAWATLQAADVPIEASLDILATVAWGLWLWLAASVGLRLIVLVAEVVTHGAAWVGTLRTLSDRLTLPVVRRVVDGAVVASIVVQLAGRATTVGASPLEGSGSDVPVAYVVAVAEPPVADTPASSAPVATVYRVRAGDSLWSIAQRLYGTGNAYPRIVEANVGRVMADGRTFTPSGVIQPGWELRVPLPEGSAVGDDVGTYIVRPGDSLSAIAG
jgi:LysM repeat protein